MVLLKKPERSQGFDAGGDLGGVGKLAGCEGMLIDGDGGVGCLGCVGGGFCMVMRLERYGQHGGMEEPR